eukprot:7661532-Pyramimonas_sp.AAC.1
MFAEFDQLVMDCAGGVTKVETFRHAYMAVSGCDASPADANRMLQLARDMVEFVQVRASYVSSYIAANVRLNTRHVLQELIGRSYLRVLTQFAF